MNTVATEPMVFLRDFLLVRGASIFRRLSDRPLYLAKAPANGCVKSPTLLAGVDNVMTSSRMVWALALAWLAGCAPSPALIAPTPAADGPPPVVREFRGVW